MGVLLTHGDKEVRLQVTKAFTITPSDTADVGADCALYCNGDMTLALIFVDDPETLTSYNQNMGTGDGTTNTVGSGTLTNAEIKKGSIVITDGINTIKDDGTGNLIEDGTGTINYVTGVMTVKWAAGSVPKTGTTIWAAYQKVAYTSHIFKVSKGYQPMLVKRVLSTGTALGGESLFGIV